MARVVGQPVCGFFLDAPNDGYQPANVSYPNEMAYVYHMQNASGSLSNECQSHYGTEAWKCIMAPHAAAFVRTPWFATQSRFDTCVISDGGHAMFFSGRRCSKCTSAAVCLHICFHAPNYTPPLLQTSLSFSWQLANIAMIPCIGNVSKCDPAMFKQVQAYGPVFMEQFKPYMTPTSKNGAFLDACLIHGSTSTAIDGLHNYQAFQSWLVGNKTYGNWWTMMCGGSDTAGPCDTGPSCQKLPHAA